MKPWNQDRAIPALVAGKAVSLGHARLSGYLAAAYWEQAGTANSDQK
jgi:hypothetical protein